MGIEFPGVRSRESAPYSPADDYRAAIEPPELRSAYSRAGRITEAAARLNSAQQESVHLHPESVRPAAGIGLPPDQIVPTAHTLERHVASARNWRPGAFDVVEPSADGGKVVARVRPRPHLATLQVASPSHGEVRVSGVARFFPARAVHARESTAVVTADHCTLQSRDHYHIQRVSVSLDPIVEPGSSGHAAFQQLLKDLSGSSITQFQRSMQRIVSPTGQRETQASVPIRLDPVTTVTDSDVVQQGPGSRTKVTTHCIIETSELPIIDLLARDRGLVRSLAVAATANEAGRGPATRTFLHDTLRSAGRADDLALLEHSEGLDAPDTLLFGLFGVDIVDRASAVMVGSDNHLDQDMKVHRGRFSTGTVLDDLARIREQAAQNTTLQLPEPSGNRPLQPSPRPFPSPIERIPAPGETRQPNPPPPFDL